jgi:glycosyltransferase involved in cell wall biosynthesis
VRTGRASVADRLAITYLLEDTGLWGGVKVVLNQAHLMRLRGHRVTVVSKGEKPTWLRMRVDFRRVTSFEPAALPEADVTVATYWTTIVPASRAASRAAAHYCQGFEAALTHNVGDHPAILEAYRTRLPCLAVSEPLAKLVSSRFGRPARVVPPALESFWKPRWPRTRRAVPRVVVMHPFEFYLKGVEVGLETVRQLRASGVRCTLVRISQLPLSETERRVLVPDEFHANLTPREVARLLRGADLLLAPSWEQEGFGLPVLEAMASGVPVVASDIPAFRAFAGEAAVLVPHDSPERFAEAARGILEDPARQRTLRAKGLEVAKAFSEQRVGELAEEALHWVAEGRWSTER